jgi:hypothetical protein
VCFCSSTCFRDRVGGGADRGDFAGFERHDLDEIVVLASTMILPLVASHPENLLVVSCDNADWFLQESEKQM